MFAFFLSLELEFKDGQVGSEMPENRDKLPEDRNPNDTEFFYGTSVFALLFDTCSGSGRIGDCEGFGLLVDLM